jgi:hypothetical protein
MVKRTAAAKYFPSTSTPVTHNYSHHALFLDKNNMMKNKASKGLMILFDF